MLEEKKQVEWKCQSLQWVVWEDPEVFWVSNKEAHPKACTVVLDYISESFQACKSICSGFVVSCSSNN